MKYPLEKNEGFITPLPECIPLDHRKSKESVDK